MIKHVHSKTHGHIEILHDAEDQALIDAYTWAVTRIGKNLYALASVKKNGRWTKEYLHRLLMKPSKGKVVDHVNRNTLDNRKQNLRVCGQCINALNKDKIGRSGYPNVNKVNNRFRAMIHFKGQHLHGGYFDTPQEAHQKAMSMKQEIFDSV